MSARSRRVGLRIGLLFAGIAAASCAPAVPVPPSGPHIGDEAIVVPYPPPAAVPEVVPRNKLGPNAVWIDGEWRWDGSTWVWKDGRWEPPRPGMYFAPPRGQRRADGSLLWFPGVWHSDAEAERARAAAAKAP